MRLLSLTVQDVSRIIACLVLGLLSFVSSCERVPLLAPPDSAIVLTINTTTVPLNGTAQLTAIVTEAGGTAPQNGTVVTFTTTLGSIDPVEAQTQNGRAVATLHSGSRSGKANVRASSGGAETDPVEVLIGGAGVTAISLRVESTSTDGTRTNLVAAVTDESGNPAGGSAVTFSADKGLVAPGVVTADGNGEARATLTTTETATVTARVGATTATIQVAAPGSFTLAVTTSPPLVDEPVVFTLTPAGTAFFGNVVVDYGDGQQENLGSLSGARSFSHVYHRTGAYTVTVRATTGTGATVTTSTAVSIVDEDDDGGGTDPGTGALNVTVGANPTTSSIASNGGQVAFTATLPFGSAASSVSWQFGDGGTASGSLSTSHAYTTAGTYVATVTVISTDGRTGSASAFVTITA